MTLAGNHRLPVIRLEFYHRHLWEWTTMAANRWTHDGRKLTEVTPNVSLMPSPPRVVISKTGYYVMAQ